MRYIFDGARLIQISHRNVLYYSTCKSYNHNKFLKHKSIQQSCRIQNQNVQKCTEDKTNEKRKTYQTNNLILPRGNWHLFHFQNLGYLERIIFMYYFECMNTLHEYKDRQNDMTKGEMIINFNPLRAVIHATLKIIFKAWFWLVRLSKNHMIRTETIIFIIEISRGRKSCQPPLQ